MSVYNVNGTMVLPPMASAMAIYNSAVIYMHDYTYPLCSFIIMHTALSVLPLSPMSTWSYYMNNDWQPIPTKVCIAKVAVMYTV